jgi:hypothetical protein
VAVDVEFVVDVKGWQKAFKSEKGIVGAWMHDLTSHVSAITAVETPGPGRLPRNRTGINYGKGNLAKSVDFKVYGLGIDEVEGHIFVKPAYARYVIHGTAPHIIKPKKPGGMLRFYWVRKGKYMVLPHVNHPGTAANDFMNRGLTRGFRARGLL